MAKLAEIDEEQMEWMESRPEEIKQMIEKIPPNLLYMMKSSGHRVTIYSYGEDGTVTVFVSGQYNQVTFERRVFGIKPEDLEECDLPDENEELGVLLNEEQTRDYINSKRVELGNEPLSDEEFDALDNNCAMG